MNLTCLATFTLETWDEDLLESRKTEDAFSELFDDVFIKITLIFSYILGYLTLPVLGMVIWFEQSGQAGPYRTLINKMTSHNLEQVIPQLIGIEE